MPPDGSNYADDANGSGTRVCAVCAQVLDRHEHGNREVGWVHPLIDETPADHVAVSANRHGIAVRARCDVCSAETPEYVLPVHPFEIIPGRMSVRDWALCGDCGVLIESNEWSRVHERAVAAFGAQAVPMLQGRLQRCSIEYRWTRSP